MMVIVFVDLAAEEKNLLFASFKACGLLAIISGTGMQEQKIYSPSFHLILIKPAAKARDLDQKW